MNPLVKLYEIFRYLSKYPKIGKFLASFLGLIEVPTLDLIYFIDKRIKQGSYKELMKYFTLFYGSKIIPFNTKIDVEPFFAPTEELIEVIKRIPAVSVGYCYCRSKYQNCNNPIWTCIHIGTAKHLQELGEKIPLRNSSKEEVIELLHKTDELGLVHQLLTAPSSDYVYVICNCCPCCCVMLKNAIDYNQHGVVISSNFIAEGPNENCINCYDCLKRCYFKAISIENKRIRILKENCVGCGLCVNACQNSALKLIRKL